MISTYSLVWTILNSCFMGLIIYFLRNRTKFLIKYGTSSLIVLSLFCMVRLMLPFEFPAHQYVLRDPVFYASLLNVLAFIIPYLRPDILIPIWITGSAFYSLKIYLQLRKIQRTLEENSGLETFEAAEIFHEMAPSCPVPIYVSPDITYPALVGLRNPIIYIPPYDYSKKDLEYILLHEYTHWQRKDLYKKRALNIMCVVLWWNPIVYALRSIVSEVIEFNCDKMLSKKLNDSEIVEYLNTLHENMKLNRSKDHLKLSLHAMEFNDTILTPPVKQRFELLLNPTNNSLKNILRKLIVVFFATVWMIASYYFILQPKYDTPKEELWGEETTVVADEENAYLQEQEDGSYLFYYYGEPEEVPKEDVDAGYYYIYPIYKYEENTQEVNWFTKIIEKIKIHN